MISVRFVGATRPDGVKPLRTVSSKRRTQRGAGTGDAAFLPRSHELEGAMRILIADDETIIRLDLRHLLEAAGYEVEEARSGTEAVQLAGSWQPSVVILDVRMPGLDGIEAARRITASRPVPVIL